MSSKVVTNNTMGVVDVVTPLSYIPQVIYKHLRTSLNDRLYKTEICE